MCDNFSSQVPKFKFWKYCWCKKKWWWCNVSSLFHVCPYLKMLDWRWSTLLIACKVWAITPRPLAPNVYCPLFIPPLRMVPPFFPLLKYTPHFFLLISPTHSPHSWFHIMWPLPISKIATPEFDASIPYFFGGVLNPPIFWNKYLPPTILMKCWLKSFVLSPFYEHPHPLGMFLVLSLKS